MVGGCSARSRAQSAKAFASDEANLHSLPAIYEGSWLPQSPASRQCRAAEAANQGTEDPEREGMNSGERSGCLVPRGARCPTPEAHAGEIVARGGEAV